MERVQLNLWTLVPKLQFNHDPRVIDKNVIRQRDTRSKNGYKKYFDRCHGARNLPKHTPGDIVLQKLNHERQLSNERLLRMLVYI